MLKCQLSSAELILFNFNPILMKNSVALGFLLCSVLSCTPPPKEEPPAPPAEPAPLEIGDSRFVEMTKPTLTALTQKDVTAFLSNFADDGVIIFSSGDSLIGKAAATEYWNGRMKVIKELKLTNAIWLPVKVNKAENVLPGNWVLNWTDVMATYTTGKSMTQNSHILFHYNANNKVDRVIQYLDRAPIMEAMKK